MESDIGLSPPDGGEPSGQGGGGGMSARARPLRAPSGESPSRVPAAPQTLKPTAPRRRRPRLNVAPGARNTSNIVKLCCSSSRHPSRHARGTRRRNQKKDTTSLSPWESSSYPQAHAVDFRLRLYVVTWRGQWCAHPNKTRDLRQSLFPSYASKLNSNLYIWGRPVLSRSC